MKVIDLIKLLQTLDLESDLFINRNEEVTGILYGGSDGKVEIISDPED